jgi:hypothetical protein
LPSLANHFRDIATSTGWARLQISPTLQITHEPPLQSRLPPETLDQSRVPGIGQPRRGSIYPESDVAIALDFI